MEEWRAIPGYEGYYEISTFGNVRSVERLVFFEETRFRTIKGRPMKLQYPRNAARYVRLDLCKDLERKTMELHRLLAMTFIPNPHGYEHVDHIDRNHRNNALSNLRWTNHCGNMANRSPKSTSKTGETGIFLEGKTKQVYIVDIRRNRKKYYGRFATLEEAKNFRDTITAQTLLALTSPYIAPASDAPLTPLSMDATSGDGRREC